MHVVLNATVCARALARAHAFVLSCIPTQVYNSFGLAYRLTGESSYKDVVLDGAETLYDLRYMVRSTKEVAYRATESV